MDRHGFPDETGVRARLTALHGALDNLRHRLSLDASSRASPLYAPLAACLDSMSEMLDGFDRDPWRSVEWLRATYARFVELAPGPDVDMIRGALVTLLRAVLGEDWQRH
jgi:hypothetical protein